MEKIISYLILIITLTSGCSCPQRPNAKSDAAALRKTTAAIRDAFARGDVPAIVALHHPNVTKYFGGNNVVIGRVALAQGLTQMFKTTRMVFVGNKIESTVFNGETAVETSIFTIRITPKDGGKPTLASGRSMVVYVRYKESPTGWASIREMAQAGPGN